MEGKRSHDFLGRERLPNSREHGVTLFQNAAWPSVAAAARILASFHAISSFSSPPSPFPLSPGGEGERVGRGKGGGGGKEGGISSLFFLELSVDRPSTKAPKGERTRAIPEERDPREYFPCVFVKLVLKRQTANQSLSFFRQLFQRDLSVKERSIDNHHRPPRIFPSSELRSTVNQGSSARSKGQSKGRGSSRREKENRR